MADKYAHITGNAWEDEITHLRLRPVWRYYWKAYMFIIVVLSLTVETENWIAGLVVSLITITGILIHRYRLLFTVTSKRVMMRVGLIAKNTDEVEIRHTRELAVRQGIIERILKYGDIEISTAAGTGAEVIFIGISHPQDLKEAIRHVRNGL
jgi:uncharacterized membrane protein YdbT with pleckstrin-like domain